MAPLSPPATAAVALAALAAVAVVLAGRGFRSGTDSPVARDVVVDRIDDAVVVLDDRDHVIDVNDAARDLLGVADGEVIGGHATEAFADHPDFYERYADVDERREEVGLETDDGVRYFDVQVSPLFDARDRQAGRLFLFHDVTEGRRRREALERQNEQLDRFASIVSHDLRNPLNVAEGYAELVVETGDMDHAEEVARAHDRMEELIEDVLALARQGRAVTDTEPVEVGDLAREAWETVDTEGATLSVETDRVIEADRARLRQAFENLFRNAMEHAVPPEPDSGSGDDGDRDLTVRVGPIGADDVSLLSPDERGFFVADDGRGIPEAERDRVFEDGYTTGENGTGLGLSIAESVVEAHGWSIRATESADGGARFEITGTGDAEVGVVSPRDRSG